MNIFKTWGKSEEINIDVVTFQNVPKVFSTHFTLFGNDQTICERNNFGEFFVTDFLEAYKKG